MKRYATLVVILLLLHLESLQAATVQITSGSGNINTISAVSQGCIRGNGTPGRQQRRVSGFSEVFISGVFTVQIVQQQQFSVEIAGDKNILPEISSSVENGQLYITAVNSICPNLPLSLLIGMPDISQFTSQGASDIKISGINNRRFMLEVAGSSRITVQGKTENFTVAATGTGDIDAFALIADSVTAKTSGTGDIHVSAENKLTAASSGTGNIIYRGTPSQVTFTNNGVGELIKQK